VSPGETPFSPPLISRLPLLILGLSIGLRKVIPFFPKGSHSGDYSYLRLGRRTFFLLSPVRKSFSSLFRQRDRLFSPTFLPFCFRSTSERRLQCLRKQIFPLWGGPPCPPPFVKIGVPFLLKTHPHFFLSCKNCPKRLR